MNLFRLWFFCIRDLGVACRTTWCPCVQCLQLSIVPVANLYSPNHCRRTAFPPCSLQALLFVFFFKMSILSSERAYVFWVLSSSSLTEATWSIIHVFKKKKRYIQLTSWYRFLEHLPILNSFSIIYPTMFHEGRCPLQPHTAAAAAAKSLQSCRTPCEPRDGSPPGSPVPGIFQARTLEWVAISFSTAAAAAKSLQSCPTLCDPIDVSPPGSPVPGILQARILECVFSNAWKWKVKVKSLSRVWLLATPWSAAYQAP